MLHPRRALESDATAITKLVNEAYEHYIDRLGRKPKPMTVDYLEAVKNHQVWVVDIDQQPVGVLELMPETACLLIENVAIAPSQQGSGLGRALMLFAEAQALEQQYAALRLYTNEHFTENLAFYTRLGYTESHREPYKGTDAVYMFKGLA